MQTPKGCLADGSVVSARLIPGAGADGPSLPFGLYWLGGALSCEEHGSIFLLEGQMNSFSIKQIQVGDQASTIRRFSEADVRAFAQVSGDENPAHLDEVYAKGTQFGTRIAHGMLVSSLFSALLGTQLPGLGTIYTNQTLSFRRPVFLDEEITATITAREVLTDKNRVIFDCVAVNAKGETVLIGEATVLPPAHPIPQEESK